MVELSKIRLYTWSSNLCLKMKYGCYVNLVMKISVLIMLCVPSKRVWWPKDMSKISSILQLLDVACSSMLQSPDIRPKCRCQKSLIFGFFVCHQLSNFCPKWQPKFRPENDNYPKRPKFVRVTAKTLKSIATICNLVLNGEIPCNY